MKALAWLILLTLGVAGCGKAAPAARTVGPTLIAVQTTASINIDGKATETAWAKAPAAKIVTQSGPAVTMKALYTRDNIYLTASWADTTKSDVQRVWTYRSGQWQDGSPDDSFSVLWDIDDSLAGFDKSGCGPLCHKRGSDPASWRMEIIGPPPSPTLWPGRRQRGDMWDLSLAISNVKGLVSDYYFAVNQEYLKSPALVTPRIYRQNDLFSESAPWQKNLASAGANGAGPAYAYKPGLSIATTPYPSVDQMTPVTGDTIFREGDQLPFIIFSAPEASWRDSKADVQGKGFWKNGVWTVEISRPLQTGQTDDIAFDPRADRDYLFAVAVFNATILGHTPSPPATLRFR